MSDCLWNGLRAAVFTVGFAGMVWHAAAGWYGSGALWCALWGVVWWQMHEARDHA